MRFKMVKESRERESQDESEVYINSYVAEKLGGRLTDSAGSVKTLYEGLEMAAKTYGEMNFLGRITEHETVEYLTYAEVRDLAEEMARFICAHSQSMAPVIGICSENRPEWIITEHASYFYSGANCPIYPSFGWTAVKHILKETAMEMMFISQKSIEKLAAGLEKDAAVELSVPKTFVVYDREVGEEHLETLKKHGIHVYFFWTILQKCAHLSAKGKTARKERKSFVGIAQGAGKSAAESGARVRFAAPTPDTIATICYTSGTTGAPKGAMLTHKNFVSVSGSFLELSAANSFFPIEDGNRYLSFLPLAHVFERVVESTLMLSRCTIVYYRGNPKQLQKDFAIAKPHYFVGVPRVFNSVKAAIESKAKEKGALANRIFQWSVGLCQLFKNRFVRELFGKTVFRTVRKTFGGEVVCMLSGSAPLTAETADFFEAVFNCPFFEGYGQTETAAGNITTEEGTEERGVIGIPFTCNRIKLLSKPELSAVVENNQGELLMQGPAIFQGYYQQEALTRAVFHGAEEDKDPYNTQGTKWVKTGDIAEITARGNLRIIGRCKEIFKLSQGEYIVPEKIENQLCERKIQYVNDITIIGYSNKDYLVAICSVENLTDAQKEQIQDRIQREGDKLVGAGEMIKIEIPRKIIFTDTLASIDNGLLTPSGKKIRKKILSHFQTEIDAAYA